MKRRDFVKLVGSSLAAGAAGVPVMSAAQDKMVWKASDVHPLGYPTVEAVQRMGKKFETSTNGYTMVNASLAFHPFGDRNGSSILLSANNIFDVEARRHASFLKDFAPLAGRDLRISARFTF